MVTVRVDTETKKRMARFAHINWSGVLREAIDRKLDQEEGRNLARAVVANGRLMKDAPAGWNAAEVIRHWRERRHG